MDVADEENAWVLDSTGTEWNRTVGGVPEDTPYVVRGHTRDPRPVLTVNFWRSGAPPITDNYFDVQWILPPVGGNQPDANSNMIWDGIDNALTVLQAAYDRGWRRIQLRYPGGYMGTTLAGTAPSPHNTTNLVSMSQWWYLPQTQRDAFEDTIGAWINSNTDVEVTLYLGRTSAEPWSPCRGNGEYYSGDGTTTYDCTGTNYSGGINDVFPQSDPKNSDFMERAYQNLQYWFDDMGVDGACFDNYSGSANTYFQAFRGSPNWDGTSYLACEAYVMDGDMSDGSLYTVSESELYPQAAYSSYLGDQDIIDYDDETVPGHLNISTPSGATNSEYLMVHQYVSYEVGGVTKTLTPDDYCIETVASYPQGGYVVGAFVNVYEGSTFAATEPNFHRMTRLIYDFDLADLDPCDQADVNGDGCVNGDDYTLLGDILTGTVVRPANPGPWSGSGPFNDGYGIYHGDINDDGVVSPADTSAWVMAYNVCSPSTCSSVSCP